MIEDKLSELLREFVFNLQKISPRPIKDLEIVLPWDNYKQLQWELNQYASTMYLTPQDTLRLRIGDIDLKVSCKEVNDNLLKEKLNKCFKILSNEG